MSIIPSNQTKEVASNYRGTDKLLTGIVMAVVTVWLFAQTTLNIAPVMSSDLNISMASSLRAAFGVAISAAIFTG